TQAAREAMCEEVRRATGAELVHPYADSRVIAGQGTVALELLQQIPELDALITPVGGGGLASGVAIAAHGIDPALALFGAEPLAADDAAQSMAHGERVTTVVPDTVCDGNRRASSAGASAWSSPAATSTCRPCRGAVSEWRGVRSERERQDRRALLFSHFLLLFTHS